MFGYYDHVAAARDERRPVERSFRLDRRYPVPRPAVVVRSEHGDPGLFLARLDDEKGRIHGARGRKRNPRIDRVVESPDRKQLLFPRVTAIVRDQDDWRDRLVGSEPGDSDNQSASFGMAG